MSESNPVDLTCSRRSMLTRDQCIELRALRRLGYLSLKEIADALHVSVRQIRYACNRVDENPGTSSGRPPVLSTQQVDELEAYIQSSPAARRMSYLGLSDGPFSHWNCGQRAIRGALQKRGYRRCLVRLKHGKGEKGGRWETKRLGGARGAEITGTSKEIVDANEGGIPSRNEVGTIENGRVDGDSEPGGGINSISRENGGVDGDSEPREGIDSISRENGDRISRENGVRICRENDDNEKEDEIFPNMEENLWGQNIK